MEIDISTYEKQVEVYTLFDSFKKIGDIYDYYGLSDNAINSKKIKKIAEEINFDLNIYKERRHPKRYCLECGKELKKGQKKFCSNSCSAIYNNRLNGPKNEETRKKISETLKNKTSKNKKITYCEVCGKEINGNKKFCSIECRKTKYKKHFIEIICEECGKNFEGLTGRKFCSVECANEHFKKKRIEQFINGEYTNNGNITLPKNIREYLYKKNDYKCELCGYEGYNVKTGNTILQIHHIDGNSKNNKIENLQVICPNCHAKTENYMALNKGKSGRDKRYNSSTLFN